MSTSAQVTTARPSASWLRAKYVLFGILGLMAAYVLVHDERFLIDASDPEWPHIRPFEWWLLPHGLAGACALLVAPTQFSDRFRRRFREWHRLLGRIYVAAVFVACPLGIYIQLFEERFGGTRLQTVTTSFQGCQWMLTTGIAWLYILRRNVDQHRRWMTRSFAVALVFLEVRVITGLTGWENSSPVAAEGVIVACNASAVLLADVCMAIQEAMSSRGRARGRPAAPART